MIKMTTLHSVFVCIALHFIGKWILKILGIDPNAYRILPENVPNQIIENVWIVKYFVAKRTGALNCIITF